MDYGADPNDVAIHAHHMEHKDFGTVTPELELAPVQIRIVFNCTFGLPTPQVPMPPIVGMKWATAPPRRAA